MLQLNYAVASDRGLVRGNNEDSAFAGPHLLALADGMGGHAAGEIASQLMIRHLMTIDADPADADMAALLATAADEANQMIAASVRENPETDGMGTTLTALMFNSREFGMCHVGDSRGYRLRNGKLEQITVDDTYVQSLVDKGELAPEDISTHPQRSMILKAYTGRPVEPTLKFIDARAGDRILLCSDGLSDPVTFDTIAETLGQGSPSEAAQRLIDLALRSGGPDNVTLVIADVVNTSTNPIALPTEPVIAGALDENASEDPRPDTAAGRAALALQREPQAVNPQFTGASGQPSAQDTAAELPYTEEKKGFPWGKIVAALIVVLLIAGLIIGGLFLRQRISETYYITTDSEQLVIERGVEGDLFGRDTHSIYQRACLSADGNLTVVDAEADFPTDCTAFVVNDLRPAARGSLEQLPSGDYDQVLEQMQRLSQEILPACVTREAAEDATDAETNETAASDEAPESSEESAAATSSADATSEESSTPSRPGDLASPGVNCREVAA